MRKLIYAAAVLVLAVTLGVLNYTIAKLQQPLTLQAAAVVYEVRAGSSVRRVLSDFERNGWLEQPRLHELWLRFTGETNIQRGEYELAQGQTSVEAIGMMVAGQKVLRSVQFIEGQTFRDYLAVLRSNSFVTQTVGEQSAADIMQQIDPTVAYYEGWFFPDTYFFERGTTDVELLKTAYQRMQQVLQAVWQQRSAAAMVDTPYEALILASIIEKETGAAFERGMISGVFSRRLQKGMRLQTDPTVIYGLGDAFDGNLTRRHLRTDTPYNTYTRGGLPPTPIANPGREAIAAAVDPAPGTAVFFVAKGDGTHQFSDTLAQHNAAVRKYQRFNRRRDYQSAPANSEAAVE